MSTAKLGRVVSRPLVRIPVLHLPAGWPCKDSVSGSLSLESRSGRPLTPATLDPQEMSSGLGVVVRDLAFDQDRPARVARGFADGIGQFGRGGRGQP